MNVRSIGKQAFDAIYESNLDYVYRTACYYTQNHYQAEEITQCVFIKLYDMILSILVDTFISKISLTMQPGPKIDSISGA